jgi:hypothetical protein
VRAYTNRLKGIPYIAEPEALEVLKLESIAMTSKC